MTTEQLTALPVRDLAAPRAHLHLWCPSALLPSAFSLIEAWDFQYKTCFVWVKPTFGLGNYYRNAHELLLLGVRGGLRFRDRSVKSWLLANRTTHSTKPDVIRALIERVSPPPYLELFARRTVPGWTVFGDNIQRRLF
jgi:N6-adenosine-specific RNA methylase IME4